MAIHKMAAVGLAAVLAWGRAETCADGSQPLMWEGAISDGSQDVETALNFVNASSDSITLGNVEGLGPQVVYLRFPGLQVPPGAQIQSSKVIFTVRQAGEGHNGDFAVVVNALRRSKVFPEGGVFKQFAALMADGSTHANVTFVPDTNSAESDSQSADLTPVLQEYVRYPAYKLGNAITLLFGNGPTTRATQSREYYSFESGGAAKGPRMIITFCKSRCIGSMCDDKGFQKGKVLDAFGASEKHEGLQFQKLSSIPTWGLTIVSWVAVGLTVRLASRRGCSMEANRDRKSDSDVQWEDDAKVACIE